MPQTPSTRWCPTPDQLMILEEMYSRGVRTPNALQIQQITDNLSFYGKIEGKNVFYWFQNHKARDRQKLRTSRRKTNYGLLHQSHDQISPLPLCHHSSQYSLNDDQGDLQEASQGMDLSGKLETGGSNNEEVDQLPTSLSHGHNEWMATMNNFGSDPPMCFRALETLELFPVNSIGLIDEYCSSSKSSCSTSATNRSNFLLH